MFVQEVESMLQKMDILHVFGSKLDHGALPGAD